MLLGPGDLQSAAYFVVGFPAPAPIYLGKMASDRQLLEDYLNEKSEDAFTVLVERYLNLVYAAALRQVRSPQLAEEVAQSVFTDLARNAGKLRPNTILSAWLYQVTRRTAVDVIRRESRRQQREQIAAEITMNAPPSEWNRIGPLLDEAMESLPETDRAAVLLRYFENKSLREVGVALGTSDDAAQKRVSRAIERLREFLQRDGISIGTGGLIVAISANAAPAAPVGLALTISTAALGSTALLTAVAATKILAMTTTQKAIVGATLVAALGAGIYEAHHSGQLRDAVQSLEQDRASLTGQLAELSAANARLSNQLAQAHASNPLPERQVNELLRLRGMANLNARQIADLKSALAQGDKLPDYLVKMMNKYYSSYADSEKQYNVQAALDRVKRFSVKLGLSPQQEQQVRQLFLSQVDARAELGMASMTGSVPFEEVRARRARMAEEESNALAGVFSPEQMTAYQQAQTSETDAHYKDWSQRMASEVASFAKLDADQKQQVGTILYNLKPGAGGENIPYYADARDQIEMRMQALQGVLTPEQIEVYRQKLLADTEEHIEMARAVKALQKSQPSR